VIPLILDGENAWETFVDGGEGFLRALYGGIQAAPDKLHSCTAEEYFRFHPPRKQITTLHTGSWIGSNFDIWIGEEEENRAWDLLGEARSFLQKQIDTGRLTEQQQCDALREIYAAEGSDWFWWYGPDFSTENDALFDQLFRQHLKNVYNLCGQLPPSVLDRPITLARKVSPLFETPERMITPDISGRRDSYYEWGGSGLYIPGSEQGAMFRSERTVYRLAFGHDQRAFYLRLDLHKWRDISIQVDFHGEELITVRSGVITSGSGQRLTITRGGETFERTSLAAETNIELAVPLADIGVKPGDPISFQVKVFDADVEVERYPEGVPIQFKLLGEEHLLENWLV
jgi:hypothetical protein